MTSVLGNISSTVKTSFVALETETRILYVFIFLSLYFSFSQSVYFCLSFLIFVFFIYFVFVCFIFSFFLFFSWQIVMSSPAGVPPLLTGVFGNSSSVGMCSLDLVRFSLWWIVIHLLQSVNYNNNNHKDRNVLSGFSLWWRQHFNTVKNNDYKTRSVSSGFSQIRSLVNW